MGRGRSAVKLVMFCVAMLAPATTPAVDAGNPERPYRGSCSTVVTPLTPVGVVPFEVRDHDTARIGVDVGHDQGAPRPEDLIGLRCRRAVGPFEHDTGSHAAGILAGQLILRGRRNEHIALDL